MLIIIPVKLVDFNSSTQGTYNNIMKRFFSKSREVTLQILDKSTSETPGAKQNMLSNLPVMFNDSMSNPLRVTCDTS
jgi:hypothetical protein